MRLGANPIRAMSARSAAGWAQARNAPAAFTGIAIVGSPTRKPIKDRVERSARLLSGRGSSRSRRRFRDRRRGCWSSDWSSRCPHGRFDLDLNLGLVRKLIRVELNIMGGRNLDFRCIRARLRRRDSVGDFARTSKLPVANLRGLQPRKQFFNIIVHGSTRYYSTPTATTTSYHFNTPACQIEAQRSSPEIPRILG